MADPIVISDPNNEPVTFVNQVLGQGHLNGVINITLGVARFTPKDSAPESMVDIDMIIASRLRMDLACAQQLRDCLDTLLKKLMPQSDTTVQ